MRDPFQWSIPMGRLFGVTVRVHFLFPLLALALILYVAFQPHLSHLWPLACLMLFLLFVSVLLHEFGHCFGARMVEGDAHEILLWPLGGLASIEVPHTPRANFIAAAAGPAVNFMLCLAAGTVLVAYSLVPPLKPWEAPLRPKLYNWSDGQYAYNDVHQPANDRIFDAMDAYKADPEKKQELLQELSEPGVPPANVKLLTPLQTFMARVFWLNWFLLVLNLLPGFPLDGGRMLHALLWWRGDYRQGMQSAIMAGFVVMVIFIIVAILMKEPIIFLLAWIVWSSCKMQWVLLEGGGEEALFGYDFSQGYTSLEREPSAPRARRPNFIQRWRQRRAARKQQREQERRESEERRLDELLEKVQQVGIDALTDEEKRFLTRVSSRYRDRTMNDE